MTLTQHYAVYTQAGVLVVRTKTWRQAQAYAQRYAGVVKREEFRN
jgi:hypothetical protein